MNIRTKILIFILSSSVLIFLSAISFLSYNQVVGSMEQSKTTADLYAGESAQIAQTIFEGDLHTINALRNAFEGMVALDEYDNDVMSLILQNSLLDNPQFISTWMSWELDFVDESWEYPYGRVRTSTLLDKGTVTYFRDSVETEGDEIEGTYYKFKIGEIEEILTDPYFYTYSDNDTGTSFLEASMAVTMKHNQNFVGIVGMDFDFDRFNEISENKTPFKNSYTFMLSNNGTVVYHPERDFYGKIITKVLPEYAEHEIVEKVKAGQSFSFWITDSDVEQQYVTIKPVTIGNTNTPWAIGYVVPRSVIMADSYANLKMSALVAVVGILVLMIAVFFISGLLSSPIKKTTKILTEMEKGNIDKSLKIESYSKDEIGQMAKSMDNLIDSLNNTANFAKEIGEGNLEANYKIQSDNDVLGKALLEMKKNLINAQKIEEDRKKESEKLSWLQVGITEINEILRMENENLSEMSYKVLKYLIEYLDANQGGFYIVEDEIIKLSAAYAYDRKKQIDSTIEKGEGLIGRCVKEKQIINITNLPEGYLFITSGLGEESPKNLIVVPLIFEDTVFGIIEIASFNQFGAIVLEFMNRVSERIGSSISNLQKTIKTADLLKASQEQALQLKEKEEEIENRMQALEVAQKEVELNEIETAGLIDAISHSASIVQYDMQGNIINIDDYKLSLMGYSKEELIGRNQSEFAIEATENPEWYEKFWEDLRKGITRKRTFKMKKDNRTIIYDETYIPIMNENRTPYKVINFGLDITEITKLKKEIENLKANKK